MNKYRVSLTTSAETELHGLPASIVARIFPRVERLAIDPRPPGCKKLVGGHNEWRIRVGDYRIVYEINDDARKVEVTRVGHRREVYD